MDFGYSEENERFRREIRAFIAEKVTPAVRAELREMAGHGMGPLTR